MREAHTHTPQQLELAVEASDRRSLEVDVHAADQECGANGSGTASPASVYTDSMGDDYVEGAVVWAMAEDYADAGPSHMLWPDYVEYEDEYEDEDEVEVEGEGEGEGEDEGEDEGDLRFSNVVDTASADPLADTADKHGQQMPSPTVYYRAYAPRPVAYDHGLWPIPHSLWPMLMAGGLCPWPVAYAHGLWPVSMACGR